MLMRGASSRTGRLLRYGHLHHRNRRVLEGRVRCGSNPLGEVALPVARDASESRLEHRGQGLERQHETVLRFDRDRPRERGVGIVGLDDVVLGERLNSGMVDS